MKRKRTDAGRRESRTKSAAPPPQSALIALRIREPGLPRPYRVPGGLFGAIAVGVPPLALLVLTVIRNDAEPIGPINALQFGALLIGAGMISYFLNERIHDHR